MICVITGDVVGSRKLKTDWMIELKQALNFLSPHAQDFEIFRGDSFQIKVLAKDGLIAAIYLKACMKRIKMADVRMSLGIGKFEDQGVSLSESNGDAFLFSGLAFDALKNEKVNLKIKSINADFDTTMNLYLKLALITMDKWSVAMAELVKSKIEWEDLLQTQLAERLGKTQSAVSESLKRAHFNEIMEINAYFKNKLSQLNIDLCI